jgi:hypothetical protein
VKLVIRGERLGFDAPFPLRAPSYNDVEIEGQKCLVVWL